MYPKERVGLPFGLKDNDKFSILAMAVARSDKPKNEVTMLDSGLRIYNSFPLDFVPEFWQSRMGSQNSDRLRWSNLVIVGSKSSDDPSTLDQEHTFQANRVSSLVAPLCLQRVKMVDIPWRLEGSVVQGNIDIRRTASMVPIIWSEDMYHNPVDANSLESADYIFSTIELLHKQGTHNRLLRGLRILMRAWQDREPTERMHCVARALDAITCSEKGDGQKMFRKRCQIFVGQSKSAEDFFGSLYRRRSEIVHMHELKELFLLQDSEERRKKALEIGEDNMQAEIVTTEVYKRILSDPNLLLHFKDESAMQNFWAQDALQQKTAFGKPINIKGIQKEAEDREERHKESLGDW